MNTTPYPFNEGSSLRIWNLIQEKIQYHLDHQEQALWNQVKIIVHPSMIGRRINYVSINPSSQDIRGLFCQLAAECMVNPSRMEEILGSPAYKSLMALFNN